MIAFVIFLVSYILLTKSMKWLISFSLGGDTERDRDRTKHLLSRDLPYIPWATDYLWILLSSGLTVLVQSSSVVTSALVPLVSSEVISLEVRIVVFIIYIKHSGLMLISNIIRKFYFFIIEN